MKEALNNGLLCTIDQLPNNQDDLLLSCNWSAGQPGQLLDSNASGVSLNNDYIAPALVWVMAKQVLNSSKTAAPELPTAITPAPQNSKQRDLPPDAYSLGSATMPQHLYQSATQSAWVAAGRIPDGRVGDAHQQLQHALAQRSGAQSVAFF